MITTHENKDVIKLTPYYILSSNNIKIKVIK